MRRFNSARCRYLHRQSAAFQVNRKQHMATLERLASGSCEITRTEYNSAAAERALGSLDPPACSSRPRLRAPANWIHGERLTFDENLSPLFREREVRFGTDDNDDFDLASIEPSSSLSVAAGRMLHATVAFNRIGNARTLLAAGAEPEQYWRGQTPLFTSASIGNVSMVRLLHEHNASLDHPAVTSAGIPVLAPLHAAAAQGHTNVVRYMLDNRVDIEQPRESFHPHDTMTKNFAGSAGATALWLACGSGHASTVQFLLARGARVDAADDARMTPLHAACGAGHDEVAHLLLDNGASIDSLADGGTPLMSACAAGHAECVRVLLKAGADPFKEFGVAYTRRIVQALRMTDTAYECAFDNGHREVVGILRDTPQYPTSFAVRSVWQGTPPSSPEKLRSKRAKPAKPQRTTPMRDRAEKAGVSDKMRATPPGVRELIIAAGPDSSSPVRWAKLQLHAVQKANRQVVARAEREQPRNSDQKREVQIADAERKRTQRGKRKLTLPLLP